MNVVTFFKSMGLKAVKQYLENDNIRTKEMHDELKQIVDAFELVESYGGLNEAIEATGTSYIKPSDWEDLNNSINLVEQCNA